MGDARTGEIAALGTATCWALTALAFESAGRRVGSLPVNLLRLVLAYVALSAFQAVQRGVALPFDAPRAAWVWLGLSGLVGFTLGDLCLFRAFVEIGSRLSLLVHSLVPALVALLAWVALHEPLAGRDVVGMAVTIAGITAVILERPDAARPRPSARGVLLALGGAAGQAGGLLFSKIGLAHVDPLPANQIRMTAGIAGFLAVFAISRGFGRLAVAVADRPAMLRVAIGAFFGPLLGVTLSLVAVRDARAGVAATLMALTPVLVLPLLVFLRRERITLRAAGGAALAVTGAALLLA